MSKISVTTENGVNIAVTPRAPRPILIKKPGVQGIKGDKGDQGEAATIEVGTVTTVAPDDPAAVTNVGTPQEAVFDFSIPRGQPGVVQAVVAGTNVTVNNADPANPVVNASGSVSSVAMTVPTGLSVSGSPITTSGTFALSYASGYQGYTTTEANKLSGIEAGADVTDAGNVGAAIHGAASKTTPVDADTIPLIDSAASNVLKKLTWANLKTTLASAFLTLGGSVQTITGLKRFSSSGPIATPTGAAAYMEAFCATATGNGAFIAFHRSGNHAVYFGLDTDNELKFGGWSRGANAYKIWHEANFTPGDYLPLSGGTMTGPISFGSATGDKLLLYGTNYGMAVLPSEFAMWAASTAAFRWRWNSSAGAVGAELTSAGFKLAASAATPTDPLHVASKQYADTKLPLAGGTLTNFLTLHADPSNAMHAATKQYVDNNASGIGISQAWQDVSGSRLAQTSYQNTTGKPIMVAIKVNAGSSGSLTFQVSDNGSSWLSVGSFVSSGRQENYVIVPPNWYYRSDSNGSIERWMELR